MAARAAELTKPSSGQRADADHQDLLPRLLPSPLGRKGVQTHSLAKGTLAHLIYNNHGSPPGAGGEAHPPVQVAGRTQYGFLKEGGTTADGQEAS